MVRRRSLTTRLVFSHLLATATALVVLSGLVVGLLAYNLRAETLASLQARASVYAIYAADLAPTPTLLRAMASTVVARFPTEPDTVVRIFGTDGTLLSADVGLGPYPSREARNYIANQLLVLSSAAGDRRYLARPIVRDGTTIGVVEVSRSLAAERRPVRNLLLLLVPGGTLALIVATLLALGLARGLLRPLRSLRQVARRIADGDLAARSGDYREDEIGQLAATIDQMAADLGQRIDEVERLAVTRREFYRSVSHELRTPLTAIRGLAENLEDDATDAQVHSLGILQAETARLERLVEELLAGGDAFLEPARRRHRLDLTALVQSVVDLMRPRAERSGVVLRFTATAPTHISGDADRLRQALVNLLDNALKWTPAGGKIDVEIERNNADGATDRRRYRTRNRPGATCRGMGAWRARRGWWSGIRSVARARRGACPQRNCGT